MTDLLNSIGFGSFSIRGKKSFSLYLLPFAFCLFFIANVNAQDEEPPANLAPPPLKIISKDEKTALNGLSDVKDRTKLTLDLMDVRLKKAEELNKGESYNAMLAELGGFQALMDDALRFLNRSNDRGGKVMNTFKKFEMTLRAFTPRLELIRRDSPERFEFHVRKILRIVRDTRTKAVEPMFSSTILPNSDN